MGSSLFGRIALFSGIILAGSTLPDIFRFIEGKEWLGHSPLIPVLILCIVAVAYWVRLVAKCILKEGE